MPTGKRLLNYCMPQNYKQGFLYPTSNYTDLEKSYGNRKAKKAGHVRKAGQNKLRKQLEKELNEELEISLKKGE
jgi:hypothetical protein